MEEVVRDGASVKQLGTRFPKYYYYYYYEDDPVLGIPF